MRRACRTAGPMRPLLRPVASFPRCRVPPSSAHLTLYARKIAARPVISVGDRQFGGPGVRRDRIGIGAACERLLRLQAAMYPSRFDDHVRAGDVPLGLQRLPAQFVGPRPNPRSLARCRPPAISTRGNPGSPSAPGNSITGAASILSTSPVGPSAFAWMGMVGHQPTASAASPASMACSALTGCCRARALICLAHTSCSGP